MKHKILLLTLKDLWIIKMNTKRLALSSPNGSKGFSAIEVLLASSIFILIVAALMGAFIYGSESTALAGQRARAVFLAEEGLEASRNIRDASFSNLSDGTTGLAISGNQWIFSGTSDTTDDFYTRQITISAAGTDRKQVASTVTWQQNNQRTGSVSLTTNLTNWRNTTSISSCTIYCQTVGNYTLGTCRENSQQCISNSETYESGGDSLCTGGTSADTCCCKP